MENHSTNTTNHSAQLLYESFQSLQYDASQFQQDAVSIFLLDQDIPKWKKTPESSLLQEIEYENNIYKENMHKMTLKSVSLEKSRP